MITVMKNQITVIKYETYHCNLLFIIVIIYMNFFLSFYNT